MSDTTTDEAADIQLEDMTDGLETTEATEVPASTEETKEESKAEETTDEAEESKEESKDESQETETESEETQEESETEEVEEDPEEIRKEAARQAYQERQAKRQEREQTITEAREADIRAAEEQGADDEQIAIKQLQWQNYENTVTANTERLQAQYDRAVATIDLFNSESPAIKNLLNDAIDEFQAKNVTFDRLGNPLEVKGNLTEFLTIKAGLIEDIAKLNVAKGKSAVAKQKAIVTPKPSGSPKQATTNKDIDDFESFFNQ